MRLTFPAKTIEPHCAYMAVAADSLLGEFRPTALFAPLAELFVRVFSLASLSALLTSAFRAEADHGSVGMFFAEASH